MGKLQVIVGGQYGSEAKGAVAAALAHEENQRNGLMAVRVAGPNAGHTVYDADGHEWKMRQLPVAAVTQPGVDLAIAAGSEIDPDVLQYEIELLAGYYGVDTSTITERVLVDPQATIIESHHVKQESSDHLTARLGSTGKGVGAARAARINREAMLAGEHSADHAGVGYVADAIRRALWGGKTVQIEGTQGFGLGLHAGLYPYCTSSDCRAVDFLSMAGVSPWDRGISELEIWVVLRTYPIRVAGNSGPMHRELDWDHLGDVSGGHIQPEVTTVTQKIRRVGAWDRDLARAAIDANGGRGNPQVHVALSFMDYWVPDVSESHGKAVRDHDGVRRLVRWVEDEIAHPVALVGTGPSSYTRWER